MSNNLFNKFSSEGLEEAQDRLGGFSPFDSDIYTGKIKAFYAGTSSQGATFVAMVVDVGGREYRETVYVSDKKGQNFFLNKDDKTKKVPLPGFTIIDDICLITTGKPLSEQETEDKVINIYNFEAKKDEPKSVPMLTEVIGKDISLGILKILENKSKKDGDNYVVTAETREINNIDKVFHPEMKLTVAEARNGAEEAKFWDAWESKNKGQTRDKREIKDGAGDSGRPTRTPGAAPTAGAAPGKSLFGKK